MYNKKGYFHLYDNNLNRRCPENYFDGPACLNITLLNVNIETVFFILETPNSLSTEFCILPSSIPVRDN